MWDLFFDHFDNIALSVIPALDEMRHLITSKRTTTRVSIFQQLEVLDQVKMVTNREVNSMVSFSPSDTKRKWTE